MDHIVILESRSNITERAFSANYNSSFLVNDTRVTAVNKPRTQRPGTPEPAVVKLALKFSIKPRSGGGEFVIGSGAEADIRIGAQKEGVSARHLLLGFDARHNVTVKDVSSRGSLIQYSGPGNTVTMKQTKGDKNNPSPWVVPQGWTVHIRVEPYSFKLTRPTESRSEEYDRKVTAFMQAARQNPLEHFSDLALSSGPSTAVNTPGPGTARKAYIRGEQLGKGGAGHVYKMYDSSTWEPVAGKVFKDKTDFEEEVGILSKIKHDTLGRIARHLPTTTPVSGDDGMLVVMEYFKLGDLYHENKKKKLNMLEIMQITVQVCEGLEYLHSPKVKVAHRDIKPDNILVRSRFINPKTGLPKIEVALGDFGSGKWGQSRMISDVGTYGFEAPELLAGKQYTNAVDIWSLAMTLLKLLGARPSVGIGTPKYGPEARAAAESVYSSYPKNSAESDFCQLILDMLSIQATSRPVAGECKKRAQEVYRRFETESLQPPSAPTTAPPPPPPSARGPPKHQGANNMYTSSARPLQKAQAQGPPAPSPLQAQGQQQPQRLAVPKQVRPETRRVSKTNLQTASPSGKAPARVLPAQSTSQGQRQQPSGTAVQKPAAPKGRR